MAHVEPKSLDELAAIAPVLEGVKAFMGFVPNSMLTMAHMPQLTLAFSMLSSTVFGGDLKALASQLGPLFPEVEGAEENLPPHLVQLIALASSVSSGCRYCQSHTSHNAAKFGVDESKLNELLSYDTSSRFDAAERAALALAFAAGEVPNGADATHFEALSRHFSDRQIVQIVAVISLFGFLNRWNDTMATTLEAAPWAFAEQALGHLDWQAGKHR